MPQLDKLTYSSQIFWLLIFFTFFYFYVLKNILPKILLNQKIKVNTLEKLCNNISNMTTESKNISSTYIILNTKIANFTDVNLKNIKNKFNTIFNSIDQLTNILTHHYLIFINKYLSQKITNEKI